MKNKNQDVSFLNDDEWLNDFAFLTDINHHLFELNIKLQGKNQLIHKMIEHFYAFEKKLELFKTHL